MKCSMSQICMHMLHAALNLEDKDGELSETQACLHVI